MKKLILIRHAKSSWDNPNLADYERPLNQRGRRDAEFMSKFIQSVVPKIDFLYSSSAERARETSEYFIQSYNLKPEQIKYEHGIYENGIRYLVKLIQNVPDDIEILAVIGHNPDITAISNAYTTTYFDNIPTCGIVGIDFDIKSWKEFGEAIGKVYVYEYPKKYLK